MWSVVVGANVFVSFFVERNEAQRSAARALADAAIVAVATANRCDAVATFDRKLSNRLETFGLAGYR